jgi:hypothetical protein
MSSMREQQDPLASSLMDAMVAARAGAKRPAGGPAGEPRMPPPRPVARALTAAQLEKECARLMGEFWAAGNSTQNTQTTATNR